MGKNLEEFKEVIKNYPNLKFSVREGKVTWQNLYEEWVMLGEESLKKIDYIDSDVTTEETKETMKTILKYVQKIKPENLTNTLGSIQKMMQIFQGFSSMGQTDKTPKNNDPLFRRFNKWD